MRSAASTALGNAPKVVMRVFRLLRVIAIFTKIHPQASIIIIAHNYESVISVSAPPLVANLRVRIHAAPPFPECDLPLTPDARPSPPPGGAPESWVR